MRALSRKTANRKSTLRNLATSLILCERIKTTTAKAKELRPVVERLISIARKNDLIARRRLIQYLWDEKAVKKALEMSAARFKNLNSGFTRIIRLGNRLGDGADISFIEFVEGEKVAEAEKEKTTAKKDNKEKNGKEKVARAKSTTKKAPKS